MKKHKLINFFTMKACVFPYLIVFLFFSSPLFAQRCDTVSFQNIYWFQGNPQAGFTKAVADKQGNLYLGGTTILNYNRDAPSLNFNHLIIKTNIRGTPLWAKDFGTSRYDFLNDMAVTKDGGVVIAGQTREYNAGQGWVYKLDGSGKIVWTYGTGQAFSSLSNVIALSDGGVAVVGSRALSYKTDDFGNVTEQGNSHGLVMVLDADGKRRWYKEIYHDKEYDYAGGLSELKDGSLLVLGNMRDAPVSPLTSYGFVLNIDAKTGAPLWQKRMGFYPFVSRELPSSNIRLYSNTDISEIDKDGNQLWTKTMDFSVNFTAVDPVLDAPANESEDFFIGLKPGSNSVIPYLFSTKDFTTVSSAYSYRNVNGLGGFNYMTASYFNGQFLLNGNLVTQNFSTSYPNLYEYQGYLLQTDSKGYTPCAQEEALTINAIKQPDYLMSAFGLTYTDVPELPTVFGVVPTDLSPHLIKDCYQTRCCTDTVSNKETEICYGSQYTLPDGNAVGAAGIYPSYFKTSKGCDSIIYTKIAVKQPLKASLGNDTCFTGGNNILYSLPYSPQAVRYLWQDQSRDSFFVAKTPGQYWVNVQDNCLQASDTVTILKDCNLSVYIPTAFTPNGDGLNDVFRISNLRGQHLLSLTVYNRWGEKVFATSDPTRGWDGAIGGRAQPSGVYVFIVAYVDFAKTVHHEKGTFALIR